jgi:hypothetical protein
MKPANNSITSIRRPAALYRPPVFGDREQIRAIYEYEWAVEQFEREREALSRYHVRISFSGENEVVVMARSAAEAKDKALERVDIGNAEVDIDFVGIFHVEEDE